MRCSRVRLLKAQRHWMMLKRMWRNSCRVRRNVTLRQKKISEQKWKNWSRIRWLNRITNAAIDLLKLYFDIPYVGSNLVLGFNSRNNDGNFITPQGIIVNSELQFGEQGNPQYAGELATHGMRAFDRTTTLKKVCCVEFPPSLAVRGRSMLHVNL